MDANLFATSTVTGKPEAVTSTNGAINIVGGISGGTANAIAKFSSATALTTSTITDDGASIVIKPTTDSTSSIKLAKAAGTAVLTVDTTNSQLLMTDGSQTNAA